MAQFAVVPELSNQPEAKSLLRTALAWRAGLERWWEARKIWGSIVSQSRNVALIGFGYAPASDHLRRGFLR